MQPLKNRIQVLEAQMNAMAQAWLYLAAHIEIHTGIDMEKMEAALCERHWPSRPDIDPVAHQTLTWLCDQLADARINRQAAQEELISDDGISTDHHSVVTG